MKIKLNKFLLLIMVGLMASCSTPTAKPIPPKLNTEVVTYMSDSINMQSYIVYDENKEGKRPAILVIPEWWGLNDYAKRRANELAEMGYLAMAVDMYGNGKTADNPKDAGAMAGPFYQNPQMAKSRFEAALNKLKNHNQADTNNLGAMGYCFGGGVVLNVARLGENLKGVVSFHGSLLGTPLNKELLRAKVLILHGEADQFVPASDVSTFKRQMDSIGANYIFKSYPGATHAFTNPDANATGKKFNMPIEYNAIADSASFKEMKSFFGEIFKK